MNYVSGDLRDQLAHVGYDVVQAGLVCGSGGNLSARIPDEDAIWVTASGSWLDRLSRTSFAPVRISDGEHATVGTTPPPRVEPTSELALHLALYRARPDVNAVVQWIQQIMYWQQQIQAMANQLNQLQQTYGSITGGRGMEGLLPITQEARNYLPSNYGELIQAIEGNSIGYADLSNHARAVMAANAVLSNPQLANMTPEVRQLIENGRRAAAMITHEYKPSSQPTKSMKLSTSACLPARASATWPARPR